MKRVPKWIVVVTAPIWVSIIAAVLMYGAAFFVNNALYGIPSHDTLDLNGRKMLVAVAPDADGNKLELVEFGKGNEQTKTMIPGSQGLSASTAIMRDGTVLWSDTSDGTHYKIWKWNKANGTTLLTSLQLFDLATYAKEYQAGTAQPLSAVQDQVSDLWRLPFIVDDEKGTIGFLDAIVTRGERGKLTEAEVRYEKVLLSNGLLNRERVTMLENDDEYWLQKNNSLAWLYFAWRKVPRTTFEAAGEYSGVFSLIGDQDTGAVSISQFTGGVYQTGVVFSNSANVVLAGKFFPTDKSGEGSILGVCPLATPDSCAIKETKEPTALLLSADSTRSISIRGATHELFFYGPHVFQLGLCARVSFFSFAASSPCIAYYTHGVDLHDASGTHILWRLDTVGGSYDTHSTSIDAISDDHRLVLSRLYTMQGESEIDAQYIMADATSKKSQTMTLPQNQEIQYLK